MGRGKGGLREVEGGRVVFVEVFVYVWYGVVCVSCVLSMPIPTHPARTPLS